MEEVWRFVAIMGQSGSGKSALLDVLADVESADAGEIDIGRLDWMVRRQRRRSRAAGGNAAAIIEPYKYDLTRSDGTFQTVSVLSGQKDMSYGIWSYDAFGQGRSSSRRLLASCHVFHLTLILCFVFQPLALTKDLQACAIDHKVNWSSACCSVSD